MIANEISCKEGVHLKIVNAFCPSCNLFICNKCSGVHYSKYSDHELLDPHEITDHLKKQEELHNEEFIKTTNTYETIKGNIKQQFETLYSTLQFRVTELNSEVGTYYNEIKDIYEINTQTFKELKIGSKTGDITSSKEYELNLTFNTLSQQDINTFNDLVNKISIKNLKNPPLIKKYFKLGNNPTFSLSNDNQTVTVNTTGHNNVFSEQSYSSGIHFMRVRIDKINANSHWMYFGACDKQINTVPNTGCSHSKGVSSQLQCDNGVLRGNLKANWKDNDIFSLTLDCDQGTIQILNESTGEFEIRSGLLTNNPIHFYLNLFNAGNKVTIINQ